MRIAAFGVVGLLVLVSCDSTPTAPSGGSGYPTTFPLLTQGELQTLTAKYSQDNPHLCSSLDDYGFSHGMCFEGQGVPTDPDMNAFIATAENFLRRNADYTGVRWNDELVVRRTAHTGTFFRIDFEDQTFKGLPVEGTPMNIAMDSNGVFAVNGHHYPRVVIPISRVSPGEAQQSTLGLVITYYTIAGKPVTYTVSRDDFVDDPVRAILPSKTERGLELRVAWRVPIRNSWYVYVDTVTGEQLFIKQRFVS